MSDNLIGLIILIVAFNVFARILRAVTRAAKPPPGRTEPGATRRAPGGPEMEPGHAREQTVEGVVIIEDEGPFAWARETESSETLHRKPPQTAADDDEFLEHVGTEWARGDTFEPAASVFDTGGDIGQVYSGWSDGIDKVADVESLRTDGAQIAPPPRTPSGLAGIERRWNGARLMVIHATIFAPCPAARRRPW